MHWTEVSEALQENESWNYLEITKLCKVAGNCIRYQLVELELPIGTNLNDIVVVQEKASLLPTNHTDENIIDVCSIGRFEVLTVD